MLLSFPDGYTPNKNQEKILTQIERGIENDEKFMIVNAPTGAGKSFIGKTIANYFEGPTESFVKDVEDYTVYDAGAWQPNTSDRRGVFALTITKSLQDQYVDTFEDTGVLKGKSNYICDVDNISTVDTAPCNFVPNQRKTCWSCNGCSYYNDRNNSLIEKFSTLNYSMFFALPDQVKHRKVLILDEGSELEEQLVSQFTCEIDFKVLQQHDIDFTLFPTDEEDTKAVAAWVKDTLDKCVERLKDYINDMKNSKNKKSPDYKKLQTNYSFLLNYSRSIDLLKRTYFQAKYIIDKDSTIIKFIPLYVNKLSSHIFNYADHVIILSATIINCPLFAKILGIEDYKFINVETEFDPVKAPILVKADQKINYANQQKMLPVMTNQIKQLMDSHPDVKGIIHTHTQAYANFLMENIDSDRLLVRTAGVTNEDIMEQHIASDKPTILVSPSMTYGVDLKEELGEFQIIMKTPWLPTKEARTSQMMKFSNSWYVDKMLCTVIQACGRIIRSKNCEGPTYILDGGLLAALHKNKKKLPLSFLNRFV